MTRTRLMLLVFPALSLLSVVLDVYGRLSIPLLTRSSLLLAAIAVGVGLGLGGVLALMAPGVHDGPRRRLLFGCAAALVVLVIVDVAFGGHRMLTASTSTRLVRLLVLIASTAILAGAFSVLRKHAGPFLFTLSCAFLLSTVVAHPSVFRTGDHEVAAGQVAAQATDSPPFVYLLMDSAMGVEGLAVAPHGDAIAAAIRDLFLRHGFFLHGGAYSRHSVSARSISNALNFDFGDNSWGPILRYQVDQKVSSPIFDDLSRRGYEIVSYGTAHIDVCFPVATRCEVFDSFNPSTEHVPSDSIRTAALLQIVWSALPGSYVLYAVSNPLFALIESQGWPAGLTFMDVHAFPSWFRQFEAEVVSAPLGRAYFAHFLMPHAPFVFQSDCRQVTMPVVADYLVEERGLSGADLERVRDAGYRAYALQYGCLVRTLDSFLTRLDASPALRDATIVIHGDHGSRISAGRFAETVSDRDIVDNNSALFAVRRPDLAPGYDTRKISVQRLMAEYFGPPGTTLGPDEPTVVLDSREEGIVAVRPMPDFGNARNEDRTSLD